jgi:hypothetical protein
MEAFEVPNVVSGSMIAVDCMTELLHTVRQGHVPRQLYYTFTKHILVGDGQQVHTVPLKCHV